MTAEEHAASIGANNPKGTQPHDSTYHAHLDGDRETHGEHHGHEWEVVVEEPKKEEPKKEEPKKEDPKKEEPKKEEPKKEVPQKEHSHSADHEHVDSHDGHHAHEGHSSEPDHMHGHDEHKEHSDSHDHQDSHEHDDHHEKKEGMTIDFGAFSGSGEVNYLFVFIATLVALLY